jgi:hypothetical protein
LTATSADASRTATSAAADPGRRPHDDIEHVSHGPVLTFHALPDKGLGRFQPFAIDLAPGIFGYPQFVTPHGVIDVADVDLFSAHDLGDAVQID